MKKNIVVGTTYVYRETIRSDIKKYNSQTQL